MVTFRPLNLSGRKAVKIANPSEKYSDCPPDEYMAMGNQTHADTPLYGSYSERNNIFNNTISSTDEYETNSFRQWSKAPNDFQNPFKDSFRPSSVKLAGKTLFTEDSSFPLGKDKTINNDNDIQIIGRQNIY